jgi:hypothetical protein
MLVCSFWYNINCPSIHSRTIALTCNSECQLDAD